MDGLSIILRICVEKPLKWKKSVNYESVDLFLNFLFSHLTIFTAAKLPL